MEIRIMLFIVMIIHLAFYRPEHGTTARDYH